MKERMLRYVSKMFSFGLMTVVMPELPMGVRRRVLKRSFLKAMTSSFGRRSDESEEGFLMYLML
ncbi:MAG: hypothetical protein U5L72_12830 [Bacteroidales bacterium]|nr:hypothetical protein [Bacteroidales bacterium]